MNRRLAILLLGLVVAVSGCTNTDSTNLQELQVDAESADTNMTGPELLNSSVDAISEIESHSTSSSDQMALDASVFSLSINMSTEAAADYSNRTAKSETAGNISAGASFIGTNTTGFEAQSYTERNTSYVKKSNETENNGEWRSINQSFDNHPATLNAEMFEDTKAELVGQQEVNGNSTYVLSLDKDAETLGQHFTPMLTLYGPDISETNSSNSSEVNSENVEKTQAYLWINQKTYEPVKLSYYLSIKAESSDKGLINADGSVQFKSQTTYTEHNQEQNIQRLEEIE